MERVDFKELGGLGSRLIFKEKKIYDTKKNELFTGETVDYWNNGEISVINPYKDGILHGLKKIFSYEGKLTGEIGIVENVRHGKYITYDDNGEVIVEGLFENGYLKKIKHKGQDVAAEQQGDLIILHPNK